MNEINYLIISGDRNIVDYGLDLVYTLHHFIRGQQFNQLTIEPAPEDYDLPVPATGATDQDDTATVNYPVHQSKKIQLDDQTFYLAYFTLDPGSDKEDPQP